MQLLNARILWAPSRAVAANKNSHFHLLLRAFYPPFSNHTSPILFHYQKNHCPQGDAKDSAYIFLLLITFIVPYTPSGRFFITVVSTLFILFYNRTICPWSCLALIDEACLWFIISMLRPYLIITTGFFLNSVICTLVSQSRTEKI